MSLWGEFEDEKVVQSFRAFAREHVKPAAAEIDRDDLYPNELVKRAAEHGFNALIVPTQYAGRLHVPPSRLVLRGSGSLQRRRGHLAELQLPGAERDSSVGLGGIAPALLAEVRSRAESLVRTD